MTLSVAQPLSPSIAPIGLGGWAVVGIKHDVEALEDATDPGVQRALERLRQPHERTEQAADAHRLARARVELRMVLDMAVHPFAHPVRRARHEAGADEAVGRVGDLDVVAEAREHAGDPLDLRAHRRVQLRRNDALRGAPGRARSAGDPGRAGAARA